MENQEPFGATEHELPSYLEKVQSQLPAPAPVDADGLEISCAGGNRQAAQRSAGGRRFGADPDRSYP